jgi:GAF domain-containing protein
MPELDDESTTVSAAVPSIVVEAQEWRDLNMLFSAIAEASAGAGTPRDFMLALSFALQPVLPHDGIELLIPDTTGEQHYRLGLHGHGSLWADPALIISRDRFDSIRLFEAVGQALVRDGTTDPRGPIPLLTSVGGSEDPPRSLLAVQLKAVERPVGVLLLGSGGPGLYDESDLRLLDTVGSLVAARVDSFVLAWQLQLVRSQFEVMRHIPMHLSRIAEHLAGVPLLAEGTRRFVTEASALLPVNAIEFAVKLSDDARVAVVKPGVATALADLAQEPIEGTGVSRVVRGEIPYLLTSQSEPALSVLAVPLRVGGVIFGAMAMTAPGNDPFSRTDLAVAQQLADLIAPHFEIARRVPPPLFTPGWKRPSHRPDREKSS